MIPRRVDVEPAERLGAVVACLHDEIDSSNVADVILPLRDDALGPNLIVDLSDVRYLDSAGITALEGLRGHKNLVLVLPAASLIRRTLEIVGFDQIVPVFERLEDVPAQV